MARDPLDLGNELRIDVESIVCPHCDSALAKITEILAPEEVEEATRDTWTRTAGGGGIGAAVGALGGPPGVVIGGIVGSAAGGLFAMRQRERSRVVLECQDCGYRGCAIKEPT